MELTLAGWYGVIMGDMTKPKRAHRVKIRFLDLTQVQGLLELVADDVGIKWVQSLADGQCKCLLCGEELLVGGDRTPAVLGSTEIDGHMVCVALCVTCGTGFESFDAAAHRMREAMEICWLTQGRSIGPLGKAPSVKS